MQIDIVRASTGQAALTNGGASDNASDRELYAVSFQLLSGPTRRFKRLCEQLQAPLLAGSGSCTTSSRIRPSPVLKTKQRSLDVTTGKNTKTVVDTAPLAKATDDSSQWSFIDSDATADGAASSISTLCSQFEAAMAVNDSQLNSMLAIDNEVSKSTTNDNS